MNNAVLGKTMENVRNRMNLHLTTDHENAKKWFSRLDQNHIIYDKRVYVGCAVLDLSKLHMTDLHYKVMQQQHGDRAQLIYSDTDSFVYEIEHEDIYDWMQRHIQHIDPSGSKLEGL